MTSNHGQNCIVLEVLTDRKLIEIPKSCDVLHVGKIATKKEGGFKNLYDLPPTSMLNLLTADLMTDFLRIRIFHQGWLCNRDSGWMRTMCALSSSNGLLFIYTKPYKGYALKLSYAKMMKTISPRKKVSNPEKSTESCVLKLKWDFGRLEIHLAKKQIGDWRRPLVKAFDAQYPCFENSHSIKANSAPQTISTTHPLTDLTTPSTSSSDSWASALSNREVGFTAIEASSSKSDELEEISLGDVIEESCSLTSVQEIAHIPEVPIEVETTSKSNNDSLTLIMKFPSFEATILQSVYRLETEREKVSSSIPLVRISKKISYFEGLDQLVTEKTMDGRNAQPIENDTESQNETTSAIIYVPKIPSWKLALMKTPF
uniref:DUF7778 domain-containing protein n=1 Tax=Acrobeloides nanus TaxID=290746 RepID=A0A914ECG6_9BILA